MSQAINHPIPKEAAPWRPGTKPAATWLAALALGFAPALSQAGGNTTYGHAEISVGFPNGHVTVGKTWETGDRTVTVTHEVPSGDADCDHDRYEEQRSEVIIEKRVESPRKIIVVERSEPEVVIIERRVSPPPRRVVVVHEAPRHRHIVVERPRREVTVIHRESHGHGGYGKKSYRHHGHHGHQESDRGYGHRQNRPRDLFPSSGERPRRDRGVQYSRVSG